MTFFRYSTFLLISIFFMACAQPKPVPMQHEAIRTIQQIRVGVVELTGTDFLPEALRGCAEDYPGMILVSSTMTDQELNPTGWNQERWIRSLQGQNFSDYESIKNFSILIVLFKNNENKNFVRVINFLMKTVRTAVFESDQLTCESVLQLSRMVLVDSHPPFADVYINDRLIGEAPVWTSLRDGNYQLQCKLSGNSFPTTGFSMPQSTQLFCQRENANTTNLETEDQMNMSEKSSSALLYIIGGIASLGGIIIPLLFF